MYSCPAAGVHCRSTGELDLHQYLAPDSEREVDRDVLRVPGPVTSEVDDGNIQRSRDQLKLLQGMEVKVKYRVRLTEKRSDRGKTTRMKERSERKGRPGRRKVRRIARSV